MHNLAPYVTTLLRPSSFCNSCLDVVLDDPFFSQTSTLSNLGNIRLWRVFWAIGACSIMCFINGEFVITVSLT